MRNMLLPLKTLLPLILVLLVACTVYTRAIYSKKHPAAFLSPVLPIAAAGGSTEAVQVILQAATGWGTETLREALSDSCSSEMLDVLKAANPQPWQQMTLAAAFAAAALKGNMVAAEHLLQSVPGYQFQDAQLMPALQRAAGPAPGYWALPIGAQPAGYDSPALVQLLLKACRFSKASLLSCLQRCSTPAIVELLLAASAEPWTGSGLLPVVAAAVDGRKVDVLQLLLTKVERVQYTEQQLHPLLLRSRGDSKVTEVLMPAVAWSKQALLDGLAVTGYGLFAKQLLGAAPEPWTAEELLPVLNAAAAADWMDEVVIELLQVEGVRYPTRHLKRALEAAAKKSSGASAVEALLKALPRCSQGVIESAINSAPNRCDNAVDKLLGTKKWTHEQLWQLLHNAISTKKHTVVRKVLVAGKGLPWDRNLLCKGLYDASTGKGSTVVLVSPFAEALAAGAAAAAVGRRGGSSKQKQVKQKQSKQQESSSSSDAYTKAVAAAHPPGGGPWAAKHFKAALQLASQGRRPNTISHLLQLPGIVWDWRCIKDAWLVAFEKDAKEVMARLLDAPGVWTPARVKEWAKEAAKQGSANAKALLEGKQQQKQLQQQPAKGSRKRR